MLLVEDNEDMRALIRIVLELSEHDIAITAEAKSGDEAIASWRRERPDLVVLDYRLPGPTGLDVARTILADDPATPIILFSAFLDDETVATAASLGVRACVSKDDVRRLPDLIHALTPRCA